MPSPSPLSLDVGTKLLKSVILFADARLVSYLSASNGTSHAFLVDWNCSGWEPLTPYIRGLANKQHVTNESLKKIENGESDFVSSILPFPACTPCPNVRRGRGALHSLSSFLRNVLLFQNLTFFWPGVLAAYAIAIRRMEYGDIELQEILLDFTRDRDDGVDRAARKRGMNTETGDDCDDNTDDF